jgi:hypothetical protein
MKTKIEDRAPTEVHKKSALTTATAGHTHLLVGIDEHASGTTTSDRAVGDGHGYDSWHSHPWLRNEDGSVTIGEAAGHTHAVGASSVAKATTAISKSSEQIAQEMLEYCDSIRAEHGFDEAKRIAEVNKNSIGNWGQVWLDTHAERVEKRGEATLASVMKSADVTFEKACLDLDTAVAAYAKAHPGAGVNEFLDTPGGAILRKRYEEAQRRRFDGPVVELTKAANDKIARLTSEVNKAVEDHAIRHDLPFDIAKERLAAASPTFAGKVDELAEAYADREAAVDKARVYAERWLAGESEAIEKAQLAAIEKREKDAERRFYTPAEKRLFARADQRAAELGCSVEKALVDIMETPEGAELADIAREERELREAGVQ